MQQTLGGVLGRRLAGAHHPVNFDLRLPLAAGRIGAQGVGDIGSPVDVVDVERLKFGDAGRLNLLQFFRGQFIVGLRQQFSGRGVRQVVGQNFSHRIIVGDRKALHPGLGQFADVLGLDPLAGLQQFALADEDIETGDFALQALRH